MKFLNKKEKSPKSFGKQLSLFFTICWVIPIIVLIIFIVISYRNTVISKTKLLLKEEINNLQFYVSTKIDEAITVTQKPSYDGSWEEKWRDYKTAGFQSVSNAKSRLYSDIDTYFKGRFNVEYGFISSAFYLLNEEELLCFSSKRYTKNEYQTEITPIILETVKNNETNTILKTINGRIFIIRNLYTIQHYERYGVLVVELDPDELLISQSSFMSYDTILCLNESSPVTDEELLEMPEGKGRLLTNILKLRTEDDKRSIYALRAGNHIGYMSQKNYDQYNLGIIFILADSEIYGEIYNFYKFIFILAAFLIPLLIYALGFFIRQIQVPVRRIVAASYEIEKGQLGTIVSGEPMPNAEFDYLMNSFNNMSKRVKYLYDYAYDEKMASKDAKIMALQSQINPHFLYNTLEMMNWQSRMVGDLTTCKMIEALSTVLDYRMNRSNENLLRLEDELRCADAYIYITTMRFGKRLQVEKEIDESLLKHKIPLLILQPILENAVVHGVEKRKSNYIKIKIYHDEQNIYIAVINSGKLTEEDEKQIRQILSGDAGSRKNKEKNHTSLGIYNVNERIRLIYGTEYGLTIKAYETDKTISLITLPYTEYNISNSDEKGNKHMDDILKISH